MNKNKAGDRCWNSQWRGEAADGSSRVKRVGEAPAVSCMPRGRGALIDCRLSFHEAEAAPAAETALRRRNETESFLGRGEPHIAQAHETLIRFAVGLPLHTYMCRRYEETSKNRAQRPTHHFAPFAWTAAAARNTMLMKAMEDGALVDPWPQPLLDRGCTPSPQTVDS